MIAIVIIVVLAIIGLGFIGGLTVEKLFLAIIMPLFPAILLAVRQYKEQIEAADRLDKLKEHAENLWTDTCNGSARTKLANKCRALQDEIFENRKCSPLVFDWIFRKLRNEYETQMNHGAEEFAEQAKRKTGMTN